MRLVLDTDVLVSALRSRTGASHRILLAAIDGFVTPLVSTAMLLEYEAVLNRTAMLAACGLTPDQVGEFLDDWAALAKPVVCHYQWRPSIRDPDDELFLEAAINGAADALVTFNLKDYRASSGLVPPETLAILRPADLIRRFQTWP